MARAAATAIPKSFFCIRFSFVCACTLKPGLQLVNATRPAPLERSWTECAKPPVSAQQERGFGDANDGHVLWLCNRTGVRRNASNLNIGIEEPPAKRLST